MLHQIICSQDLSKKHDYICAICVRQGKRDLISGQNEFMKHIQQFHKGNALICDTCDYTAKVLIMLVSHRYVKHNLITEGFEEISCTEDGCGKKFVTKTDLAKHAYLMHSDRKVERGVCPICGKILCNKARVAVHIEQVHHGISKHQCDICKKWFREAKYVVKHKAIVHRVGQPEAFEVVCDTCGRVCLGRAGMLDHVRRVHKKLHRHSCQDCGKEFYSKTQLKNHRVAVHKEATKHACPHCGVHSASAVNLKTHIDTVHLNKKHFHCRECDSCKLAN